MDRAIVRSIQVFFTVFLVLAVFTASGRPLIEDGADHSALTLVNTATGVLLVLGVGLGFIWLLPNRVMRWETGSRERKSTPSSPAIPSQAMEQTAAAGEPPKATPIADVPPSVMQVDKPVAASVERKSWSANVMFLLAIIPAVLILVIGAMLYFH